MVKRLPHVLRLKSWLRPNFTSLFSLMILMTLSGAIKSQSDSLCIDFIPTIQPAAPIVGDTVCFDWKITNKTIDTLTNVMVSTDTILSGVTIASDVIVAMSPELLPFGMMTASGSSITGSGSFMMTGSGCSIYSATDIDNGYKLIEGSVKAFCPASMTNYNTDATGIVCNDDLTLALPSGNISLSGKCDAEVDADLIKVFLPVPVEFVRFSIIEPDGSTRDRPILTDEDVNTSVKIQLDIPGCPNVAPVWNNFFVEYKLAPALFCNTDTISCAENVAMNDPIVTDACGDTQFIRIRTGRRDLCSRSSDNEFLFVDTVIYAVQDRFGNVSDTCTQLRFVKKPNLTFSDIVFPPNDTFNCTVNVFDDEGNLDIDAGTPPTWDGVPITEINGSCNVYAEAENFLDIFDGCERRLTRRWTVYEWECDGGLRTIRGPLQTIVLRDTTPPVISPLPDSLDFSVDDIECNAIFNAPFATATDACGDPALTRLEFRYLDTILNNDFDVAVRLPIGVHNLEYIATDACGNTALDTITVTVVDKAAPVAICIKELVVPITDTIVRIRATDIDNDSYDACGIDRILIARMPNDYCVAQDTIFGDFVSFCCSDGGRDIPTILRVYDMAGNFNECMVMVKVDDKSPATIIGLPDIEVSCEYTFDTDSLNVFGIVEMNPTATPGRIIIPSRVLLDSSANAFTSSSELVNGRIFDNCGASVEELDPIINIDSICRTGTITRRFNVIDASNFTTSVVQNITITNDALNNPVFFTYVPGNTTITPTVGMDIRDLATDDPAIGGGTGCARPYIGYRDQVFKVDSADYCTKVIRTWEIIDWCKQRDADNIIEEDSIQIIFVQDNEGPAVQVNSNISLPQPAAGDAIELTATATDNIVTDARQLSWSYEVFLGASTTPIRSTVIPSSDFRRDNTAVARIEGLAEGVYRVVWTVIDVCDNPTSVTQNLTVTAPDNRMLVSVVGQVLYAKNQSMDNVEVYLTSDEAVYDGAQMSITDIEGEYSFGEMPVGDAYFIDPKKDDNPLNGVSTLDILHIQRHILGLKDLETSAQKIAADVNNDGRVSAFDLLDLRKVILGRTLSFTNNDSWTFAYAEQNLDDVFTYDDALMRRYHIGELTEDMDIQFYGIKVGDVSGDAQGHSAIARSRSTNTVKLTYESVSTTSGYTMNILAGEDMDIDAMQAEWKLENVSGLSVTSGVLEVNNENINLDRLAIGSLPMSIVSEKTISVSEGDVLFSISSQSAIEELSLVSSMMQAEVYNDNEVSSIMLTREASSAGILVVEQNTPNPWSDLTSISAYIPTNGEVALRVYDVHNRVVHTERRSVSKGTHVFSIDQEKVSDSGVYFYEIETGGQRVHQKMLRVN